MPAVAKCFVKHFTVSQWKLASLSTAVQLLEMHKQQSSQQPLPQNTSCKQLQLHGDFPTQGRTQQQEDCKDNNLIPLSTYKAPLVHCPGSQLKTWQTQTPGNMSKKFFVQRNYSFLHHTGINMQNFSWIQKNRSWLMWEWIRAELSSNAFIICKKTSPWYDNWFSTLARQAPGKRQSMIQFWCDYESQLITEK